MDLYSTEKGSEWKEKADKLFTPQDCIEVFNNIAEAGLMPEPDKDITIASVASNIPTLELALYEDLKIKRTGKVTVITGDRVTLQIPPTIKQNINVSNDNIYHIVWDAKNLPLPNKSVDVIYDKKGALWYLASTNLINIFIGCLESYRSKLKDGGIVVIDNIEGFTEWGSELDYIADEFGRGFADKVLQKYNADQSQQELSTVDRITKAFGQEIWLEISRMFHIVDVGIGKHKVRVLVAYS